MTRRIVIVGGGVAGATTALILGSLGLEVTLLEREKMARIIDLFSENRYKIEDMKEGTLFVSRREFSVGAALLWFALGGVGLLVYLIYYFLKKPETLRVYLDTGHIYAE